jgi:flagellar hook-associated protein 3 FlgL
MRVTTLTIRDQRIAELMAGQERLEQTQSEVSSGKRIQRPSDSPDQIAELLQTRSDEAALTRQRDAADAAMPDMQSTDATFQSIGQALRQAKTLALQANNSTVSPEQRQVIADQIEQVRSQLLTLANTQVAGRYLFAGTNSSTAPFTAGPPVSYAGNTTPLQVGLADGTQFAVSITGDQLLNARGGTDLFQNLSALETSVRTGSSAAIAAGMGALDDDISNATRLQSDMGARVNYVQLMRQQSDDNLTAAQGRQSQLEDADMAQAILEEKTAENTRQAALAMAGRVDQTSLLDYLR